MHNNIKVAIAGGVALCFGLLTVRKMFQNSTYNKVYNGYIKAGIPATLAKLMLAQNIGETANYTSNVFKKNLNIGGMKYVKGNKYQAGPGTMSPEGNAYAKYATIENSAADQAAWYLRRISSFSPIKTVAEFAIKLKEHWYYTDSVANYTAMLNGSMKKIV